MAERNEGDEMSGENLNSARRAMSMLSRGRNLPPPEKWPDCCWIGRSFNIPNSNVHRVENDRPPCRAEGIGDSQCADRNGRSAPLQELADWSKPRGACRRVENYGVSRQPRA